MLLNLVLLPALASLAWAESTVTSMLAAGISGRQVDASIINNDATATTYSLNCHRPTDHQHCALGITNNVTAVLAGDIITWWNNPKEEPTMTMECTPAGTTKATCTRTMGAGGYGKPGTESFVISTSISYMPVTITAGSVTPAETSASQAATGGDAQSTGTDSDTDSSDATPTGGVPRATGAAGAGIALGAVAAVIGIVL